MSKVNWFYEIGQEIKDGKIDAVIIDREIREKEEKHKRGNYIGKHKYYKLKCNKCGYDEWWKKEARLKNKDRGCPCCCKTPQVVVTGINTIWDTDMWMVDLGVSEEDAKKYTHSSHKKVWVTCPDCGDRKEIIIKNMYNKHSIGCNCSDGNSYPEKFMYSVLKQLNIKFRTQLNKKDFNWCDKYRYDFYLEDYNIIIETHGGQHYKENTKFEMSLKDQQENDKNKKELALNNDINKYIEINCSKSELEFIKNNILNSELNDLFDLSKIDWNKCEEYALKNIVKEVCEYWYLHNDINNEGLTTIDLSKYFNISKSTIKHYLNKGAKLGWCNYNGEEEITKHNIKMSKPIKIFDKDDVLLGIFESASCLERKSEELFDIKLKSSNISESSNNNGKLYKGYKFEKATKEEYEEAVKNNTINKRIDNIELKQVS